MREYTKIDHLEERHNELKTDLEHLTNMVHEIHGEMKAFKGFVTALSIVGACILAFGPTILQLIIG